MCLGKHSVITYFNSTQGQSSPIPFFLKCLSISARQAPWWQLVLSLTRNFYKYTNKYLKKQKLNNPAFIPPLKWRVFPQEIHKCVLLRQREINPYQLRGDLLLSITFFSLCNFVPLFKRWLPLSQLPFIFERDKRLELSP